MGAVVPPAQGRRTGAREAGGVDSNARSETCGDGAGGGGADGVFQPISIGAAQAGRNTRRRQRRGRQGRGLRGHWRWQGGYGEGAGSRAGAPHRLAGILLRHGERLLAIRTQQVHKLDSSYSLGKRFVRHNPALGEFRVNGRGRGLVCCVQHEWSKAADSSKSAGYESGFTQERRVAPRSPAEPCR